MSMWPLVWLIQLLDAKYGLTSVSSDDPREKVGYTVMGFCTHTNFRGFGRHPHQTSLSLGVVTAQSPYPGMQNRQDRQPDNSPCHMPGCPESAKRDRISERTASARRHGSIA